MQYFVYIVCNKPYGTLYIGATNNLARRIYEHKNKLQKGFTAKYGLDRLVYYELTDYILSAFQRERNLKHYPRSWKIALIEKMNPKWEDLYEEISI